MRTSRRRTLAALLVGTGLLGSSVLALSAAALDPPPPVGLLPALSAVTNGPVCDALDESPDYADVDCDAAGASAYFGADATTLAAAVVLEQSPLVAKGAQSPMQSTTYVVQLGVAGRPPGLVRRRRQGHERPRRAARRLRRCVRADDRRPGLGRPRGRLVVVPDGIRWRMTFFVRLCQCVAVCQCVAIDSVNAGTYRNTDGRVTLTDVRERSFDYAATGDLVALIVKGGSEPARVIMDPGRLDRSGSKGRGPPSWPASCSSWSAAAAPPAARDAPSRGVGR